MKKIAMFTMGTRGDVQPYIYLARALNKSGYEATIGSHPCWKDLVEKAEVSFVAIGPDINIEKEAAIIRGKNSNPIFSMLKTSLICLLMLLRGLESELLFKDFKRSWKIMNYQIL